MGSLASLARKYADRRPPARAKREGGTHRRRRRRRGRRATPRARGAGGRRLSMKPSMPHLEPRTSTYHGIASSTSIDRQHPSAATHRLRRRHRAWRGDPRQSGMAEPGRLGEGPRCRAHDCGRRTSGRVAAGGDAARRDVGQHRHRLRDARRVARLSRYGSACLRTSRPNGCACSAPTAPTSS